MSLNGAKINPKLVTKITAVRPNGASHKAPPKYATAKWCAQLFCGFLLFTIFDRNFAKIVAPPNNENEKYVVHLKEPSILKKVLKTASKSIHKPSNNTCLNYIPTIRQTKRDIQKTPIFAPTVGVR